MDVSTPPERKSDGVSATSVQILSTDHWSLLATRGMTYNEVFSRTSIFLTVVSASVVALALVAQATDFSDGLYVFALLILPVVLLLGLGTYVRLIDANLEDLWLLMGMNRLRHAYVEVDPAVEQYFVTSRYDDEQGVFALAARWAMNSLYGQRTITEPLRQALIKTIERGDPEAALCAGWAAQRLLPGEPTPELSAKRRAAFNRGIPDARPEVRCSALDSLRTEADTTWWAVIKEVPEPASTSGTSSILTSRPVINRRMVRSTAQPEILSGLTNALADPDLGVR